MHPSNGARPIWPQEVITTPLFDGEGTVSPLNSGGTTPPHPPREQDIPTENGEGEESSEESPNIASLVPVADKDVTPTVEDTAIETPDESLLACRTELEKLQQLVERLSKQNRDYKKDADLFREEYLRASAFATDLQKELQPLRLELLNTRSELINAQSELKSTQTDLERARRQVAENVASVRQFYAVKFGDMEKEIEELKRHKAFFQEKDRRTDDEIRKKAARETEVQAKCVELEAKRKALVKDIADAGMERRLAERKLEEENERLKIVVKESKREVVRLNTELEQSVLKNVALTPSEAAKPPDPLDEIVHVCGFARVRGDPRTFCRKQYPTYQVSIPLFFIFITLGNPVAFAFLYCLLCFLTVCFHNSHYRNIMLKIISRSVYLKTSQAERTRKRRAISGASGLCSIWKVSQTVPLMQRTYDVWIAAHLTSGHWEGGWT